MKFLNKIKRFAEPTSEIKVLVHRKKKLQASVTNRLWTHSIGDLTGRLGSFVVTLDGTGHLGPGVNQIIMDDDGTGMTIYFNEWIVPADADYMGIILAFGSYNTGEWYWLAEQDLAPAKDDPSVYGTYRWFCGSAACFEMHVVRPEID